MQLARVLALVRGGAHGASCGMALGGQGVRALEGNDTFDGIETELAGLRLDDPKSWRDKKVDLEKLTQLRASRTRCGRIPSRTEAARH